MLKQSGERGGGDVSEPTYEELRRRVAVLESRLRAAEGACGRHCRDCVLEALPEAVYIADDRHEIQYVNSVMRDLFGPVDGRKCHEYVHGLPSPCPDCCNRQVFAGVSKNKEWRSPSAGRNYRIVCAPLRRRDGAAAKITFFRDVTDEVAAKEELARQQMMLQGIINNSSAVVYVKDREGKYILVNDRFRAIFRLADADVIGKTDFDLFPAEQARAFRQNDLEVLATLETRQFEEVVPQDGREHVYVSSKFPLFGADGAAYAVGGISTDITGRKRMEIEMQEINERLTALVNASPDMICFKDGEGRWQLANEAKLRFFDLAHVDYKGKSDAELAARSAFYRSAFVTCVRTDEKAWRRRALVRGVERVLHPDGKETAFEVVKVPLFNADGSRKGLVVLAHDITHRLETESRLRQEIQTRQRAVEASEQSRKETEEANIALRVLLKQQRKTEEEIQSRILEQLQKSVFPYLSLLSDMELGERGRECVEVISRHLRSIGESFIKKLSNPDLGLTKREILVADLVRQGKNTREIAALLKLRPQSVEAYRNKIRRKLRINNKKISLKQYLATVFVVDG